MENNLKEQIEIDIKITEDKIKLALENKSKILKELKKLNVELRNKERAKNIYFGEKSKKLKSIKKPETKQEEVKQ